MSGLCGIVSKANCSETLLFGTDYHSHLGSQLAGMAVFGEHFQKKIHDISQGQFKSKFSEDITQLRGHMGIGVISDSDAQPLIIFSKFGTYAMAFAGLVDNADDLTKQLFAQGSVFCETTGRGINAIELLAKILEMSGSLVEGIQSVFDRIQGSASFLILTREGIYAARDRLGRTPLVVGERNGDIMVVTEKCALTNLDFKATKILGPGEIVFLGPDGLREIAPPTSEMQICSFLWIYTGYPASSYEGISVERVRERCGACLAKRDTVKADLVAGVPDSGMGHGVGYAMASGIPFRRALVKYTPGYGRSYIPPSQQIRDHVAKMKLLAVEEVIAGNRIVLCEDSIVRGTQLKNYTIQKLWEAGAKEVHLRPACPPLMFPCRFALSTRGLDELIARRAIHALSGDYDKDLPRYIDESSEEHDHMVKWITRELNATTLRYQLLEDMIDAIGLPREKLCLYCWTGKSLSYENNPLQRELKLL